MSTVDELVWEGDPIDKRSKRTSLPLFEAWPAAKKANKSQTCYKYVWWTYSIFIKS